MTLDYLKKGSAKKTLRFTKSAIKKACDQKSLRSKKLEKTSAKKPCASKNLRSNIPALRNVCAQKFMCSEKLACAQITLR